MTPWPLFLPPLVALTAAAALLATFPRLSPRRLAAILAVLAAVAILALSPGALIEAVTYSPFDDGGTYLAQARFMLEHRTLMAGRPTFETQPGYPYALLPLVALPGFPNRLYLLVLAVVLVIGVAASVQALRSTDHEPSRPLRILATVFPLLAVPAFIKNLYLGLPEWLVFALLVVGLLLWRRGWVVLCATGLAAVAVLRQNLVIAAFLLQAVLCLDAWRRGRRGAAVLAGGVWVVLVVTPAVHNFYYGGTFAFLAHGRTRTVVTDWSARPLAMLGETALKYAGYSPTISPLGLLLSLPSVSLGTVLLALAAWRTAKAAPGRGLLFLALVASAVVPAALLGIAYYPRFELVNLSVAWAGYQLVRDASLPPRLELHGRARAR